MERDITWLVRLLNCQLWRRQRCLKWTRAAGLRLQSSCQSWTMRQTTSVSVTALRLLLPAWLESVPESARRQQCHLRASRQRMAVWTATPCRLQATRRLAALVGRRDPLAWSQQALPSPVFQRPQRFQLMRAGYLQTSSPRFHSISKPLQFLPAVPTYRSLELAWSRAERCPAVPLRGCPRWDRHRRLACSHYRLPTPAWLCLADCLCPRKQCLSGCQQASCQRSEWPDTQSPQLAVALCRNLSKCPSRSPPSKSPRLRWVTSNSASSASRWSTTFLMKTWPRTSSCARTWVLMDLFRSTWCAASER